MTHLTVTEIMKATGKSQSTILRFIRELKKDKPDAVKVEEVGKTRQYKISKEEVQKHFVISEITGKEPETPNTHQSIPLIPKGYKLIPTETMEALQKQLIAKDDQIKRLQEVNHLQSGAIANMKLLGTGKRLKNKQEKEPVIITSENKPKQARKQKKVQVQAKVHKVARKGRRQARTIEKNKPSRNKGFFQKLFGF